MYDGAGHYLAIPRTLHMLIRTRYGSVQYEYVRMSAQPFAVRADPCAEAPLYVCISTPLEEPGLAPWERLAVACAGASVRGRAASTPSGDCPAATSLAPMVGHA